MTVADLIEALQKLPPDLQVVVLEYTVGQGGGYTLIRAIDRVDVCPRREIPEYIRSAEPTPVAVLVPR